MQMMCVGVVARTFNRQPKTIEKKKDYRKRTTEYQYLLRLIDALQWTITMGQFQAVCVPEALLPNCPLESI